LHFYAVPARKEEGRAMSKTEEGRGMGKTEIKPFEGWNLKIERHELVVFQGRYPNFRMARDIAERFLGFRLNEKEKESLKALGLVHSYQSQRMGQYAVHIDRDYERRLSRAYFHINNGGVCLDVIDNGDNGTRVDIWAGHFGNRTNGIRLFTDAGSLRKLGKMLIGASKHKFSGTSCCAAKCEVS
jgi:hypothetical protein